MAIKLARSSKVHNHPVSGVTPIYSQPRGHDPQKSRPMRLFNMPKANPLPSILYPRLEASCIGVSNVLEVLNKARVVGILAERGYSPIPSIADNPLLLLRASIGMH